MEFQIEDDLKQQNSTEIVNKTVINVKGGFPKIIL